MYLFLETLEKSIILSIFDKFYPKSFTHNSEKLLLSLNLCCLLILFVLALLNQYSAQINSLHGFERHLIKTVLGISLFFITFFLDQEILERLITPSYICVLLLLGAVLLKGTTIKGATRWLTFGALSFQPSEVAKIFVPLMCAKVMIETKNSPKFFCFLITFLTALLPSFLVAKQPDLGSSILVFFSGIAPLLLLNIPLRLYLYALMLAGCLSPVAWNMLHPYQQQRIQTLLSPKEDLQGTGYHIHQSKIAIGSGELWGKGWQKNTQAKFGYLPESDTDFAYALYAEERGCFMTVGTIFLMYFFYMSLVSLSLRAKSLSLKLMGFSLAAPQFLYCFINIAMVTGLIPVVGVPLPFFSRGGSSFLIQMLSLGFIYKFIYLSENPYEVKSRHLSSPGALL